MLPPDYPYDPDHLPVDARRVFVYGSLRPGCPRYEAVMDYDHFTNPAFAEGFALYTDRSVDFPWMHPTPDLSSRVRGELLTFHDGQFQQAVETMDRLEGIRHDHGDSFIRRQIRVLQSNGEYREAWVYLANPRFLPADEGHLIPTGDWRHHLREQQQEVRR